MNARYLEDSIKETKKEISRAKKEIRRANDPISKARLEQEVEMHEMALKRLELDLSKARQGGL